MQSRDINLYKIYTSLELIGKSLSTPRRYRAFVTSLASSLKQQDEDMQRAFASVYHKIVSAAAKNDSGDDIAKLSQELASRYETLANELVGYGKAILDSVANKKKVKVSAYAQAVIDQLTQLGNDLITLSTRKKDSTDTNYVVPTKEDIEIYLNSGRQLYKHCEALGAIYLPLSQSMLPTMGVSVANGVIKQSPGNCGGMVLEWCDQYIEKGAPRLPIVASMNVINNQDKQFDRKASSFVVAHGYDKAKVTEVDFVEMFNKLEPEYPHYVSIRDIANSSGHAIGLFKDPSGVMVVFDPNYGPMYFLNERDAAIAFSFLLQRYQADKFPADNITIHQSKEKCKVNVAHAFPGIRPLQLAVEESYTESKYVGYKSNLKSHIEYISTYAGSEKWLDLAFHALKHGKLHLNNEDAALLVTLLKSIESPTGVHQSQFNSYFSADTFRKIKNQVMSDKRNEKAKLAALIADTETWLGNQKPKDERALRLLTQLRAFEKQLKMKMNDVLDAASPKNQNSARIAKILSNKYYRLLKGNIGGKLLAAANGKTGYRYEDAINELNEVLGVDAIKVDDAETVLQSKIDHQVNVEKINEHLNGQAGLFARVKFLEHVLQWADSELSNKTTFASGIYAIRARHEIQETRRKLLQFRTVVDDYTSAVMMGLDASELKKMIDVALAMSLYSIDTLPEYSPQLDCSELSLLLLNELKRYVPAGPTASDMRKMNELYLLLSETPMGEVFTELNRLKSLEGASSAYLEAIEELRNEAIFLRMRLVQAVTMAETEIHQDNIVGTLINMIRKLSPANVSAEDSIVLEAKPDFAAYLKLVELPQRVGGLLDSVEGIDPDLLAQLRRAFDNNNQFYTSKRYGLRQWLDSFLSDLGLQNVISTGYAKLTDEVILQALRTKNAEFIRGKGPVVTSPMQPVTVNDCMEQLRRDIANFSIDDDVDLERALNQLCSELTSEVEKKRQQHVAEKKIDSSHTARVAILTSDLLKGLAEISASAVSEEIKKAQSLKLIQRYTSDCTAQPLSKRIARAVGAVVCALVGLAVGAALAAVGLTIVGAVASPTIALMELSAWLLGQVALSPVSVIMAASSLGGFATGYLAGLSLFKPKPHPSDEKVLAVARRASFLFATDGVGTSYRMKTLPKGLRSN